jgi:hypothetical protein
VFENMVLRRRRVEEDEIGGACRMNWGEDEGVYVIGGKVRGEETARKTKS